MIFEPATNQVIGVKYERFGKHYSVRASKEVILSAGSIATPKILMLSGIGSEEELKKIKVSFVIFPFFYKIIMFAYAAIFKNQVPVRANLPVGRNLQVIVHLFYLCSFSKLSPKPVFNRNR